MNGLTHDPMETISALFILAAYPALYFSMGRQAWRGLHSERTITHFGIKAGWIARVYGVFYLLLLIGMTLVIPVFWESLKDLNLSELISALDVKLPANAGLGLGLPLELMALVFLPFVWWALKNVQARDPNGAKRIRFQLYSIPILLAVIGILITIGAPISILLGILLGWVYFWTWIEKDSPLEAMIQ